MSFLERMQEATIGFSGYPKLARDRAGGFGYLALLLFLVLTIAAVIQSVEAKRYLAEAVNRLEAGPAFEIRDGEVNFQGAMPYSYYDNPPNVVVIVDTTGKTDPAVLNGYLFGILVTRDTVYQTQLTGAAQPFPVRQLIPGMVTRQELIEGLPGLWVAVPVMYVFVYLFQLGAKAVVASILAFIGMAYGRRRGFAVPFELSFKLSLYAMTLPILLQWIVPGFTTIPLAPGGLIGLAVWWGVAVLYLTRGLAAYYIPRDGYEE